MSCTILEPNDENIARVAQHLQAGNLAAMPTETVYGLAADATSDEAVAKIYATKHRPQFNPLIVHIPSEEKAHQYAVVTPLAQKLMDAFWPGACTLVLERKPDCPLSLLVSAGLDTVALRMPAHDVAQKLLQKCTLPLAAPSANRSGKISPTSTQHVRDEFDDAELDLLVLEGGNCLVGIESTVIDARGDAPIILRPGSVTCHAIAAISGNIAELSAENVMHSPGMLESHYAPNAKVRLEAIAANSNEVLLGFGDTPAATLNLSPKGDLIEAAANLFAYLRKLDAQHVATIAVSPIPEDGLGIAINDRLRRAAAPR